MLLRTFLLRSNIITKKHFINVSLISCESYNYRRHRDKNEYNKKHKLPIATAFLGSVLIGSSFLDKIDENPNVNHDQQKTKNICYIAGDKRSDLPTYRADEVRKHDNKSSFWVTYRHGVYDVTSFLPSHPGGEQILNAAGLSVEPFWNVYGMHKTDDVYKLLESYRIGNLHDEDIVDHSDEALWVKEPRRDSRLIVKTARPFNAEIPAKLQIQHFDTPNELFYVRQHMPVPELDASEHSLRVLVRDQGPVRGERVKQFSLEELGNFPRVKLRAALMCAGNRRSEMDKQVKPVKGISWTSGAISNAVWEGVPLRDVLLHCGVDDNDTEGKHVIFTGADIDATGQNFSTSIPLHMALDPNARILLATHMNGAILPKDHGYPLRVVVPGAPAVRSVKWLESITVSKEESPSHWHQKDYRAFNPSKTWETADFSTAPPVYSLPVTSAICDPADGDTVLVKDGHIDVRGYAYSGGGAKILRVDVSGDCGSSWVEARCESDSSPAPKHYAWTLWTARLPVQNSSEGQIDIWVKATDSNFNTQPEKFEDIWNIRGILSNAYHKIKVRIQH